MIKLTIKIILISSCLSFYATPHNIYNEIKKAIGPRRFAAINSNQIEHIVNVLKPMTLRQRTRFFDNFNYHYTAINTSRKQDTVSIHLSTISYHQPDQITEDDINKIIKLAHRHAMTTVNKSPHAPSD